MAQATKAITVDELVKGILAGERDFSATRLAPGSDITGHSGFAELSAHLRRHNWRETPVVAENADWRAVRGAGMLLQGARLNGADLRDADLSGVDLRNSRVQGADLSGARLRSADLYEANFTGARLQGADLSGALLVRAPLKDADVTGAVFTRALFYRVDVRGAKGLDSAIDLGTGQFHRTIVTEREAALLSSILARSAIFDVQEE